MKSLCARALWAAECDRPIYIRDAPRFFCQTRMHAARGIGEVKYIRFWMHIGIFFSIFGFTSGFFRYYFCLFPDAFLRWFAWSRFALLLCYTLFQSLIINCTKLHFFAIKYKAGQRWGKCSPPPPRASPGAAAWHSLRFQVWDLSYASFIIRQT